MSPRFAAAARQAVADEVGRAVNDIGFLVITGHGIDPDLVAEVQAVSNAFFDLPEDEKRKVLRPAPDVTRAIFPSKPRASAEVRAWTRRAT